MQEQATVMVTQLPRELRNVSVKKVGDAGASTENRMLTSQELIRRVLEYHPGADVELIARAYQFASEAHEGQTRKSGDPYFSHPISVAEVIIELRLDAASVIAGSANTWSQPENG